jgi:hypothetical protein
MANEQVDGGSAKESGRARKGRGRRSWKEMSPVQRVTNIVFAIVELALTGWALWDIRHRREEQINGKKRTWAMASLIQPFGPVVYFIFGRKRADRPVGA